MAFSDLDELRRENEDMRKALDAMRSSGGVTIPFDPSPESIQKLRDDGWLMGARAGKTRALEQEHERLASVHVNGAWSGSVSAEIRRPHTHDGVTAEGDDLAPQEQRIDDWWRGDDGFDGIEPSAATIGPDYVPSAVAMRRAKAPRKIVIPTDLHIPGEWD